MAGEKTPTPDSFRFSSSDAKNAWGWDTPRELRLSFKIRLSIGVFVPRVSRPESVMNDSDWGVLVLLVASCMRIEGGVALSLVLAFASSTTPSVRATTYADTSYGSYKIMARQNKIDTHQ